MSRRPTATFTAAAVTLACLGASLYASPQVLAQNMGRQVHAFSPLDPTTYPMAAEAATPQLETTADASREQSTLSGAGTDSDTSTTITRHEEQPELHTADTDTLEQPKLPDEAADSVDPSPSQLLSRVEVTLPDPDTDASETAQTEENDLNSPDDVDSPDSLTVIVNKARPLPEDYIPADLVELPSQLSTGPQTLRQEAADAAETLIAAAQDDGVALTVMSSYRSYQYQHELYNNYLTRYGTTVTDEMSARPGYSEHQTGLAIDVAPASGEHTLQQSFGDTVGGQWLAEHAHEYGFVIRYPLDQQNVTGFDYEPWHLRYFGEDYAQHIVDNTGVAELDFGLDPAPDYTE